MAGRIARLLTRPTPETPDVAHAAEQLGRLAEAQPDLRAAATLQTALIRAIYAAPAPVAAMPIDAEAAAKQLAAGVPLLRHSRLPVEAAALREAFVRLCAAARAHSSGPQAQAVAGLEQAARAGQLDLLGLAEALVGGAAAGLSAQLEQQGYAADTAVTLLRLALLPFLEQAAAQLAPLREAQAWGRGYCPTCGAWPVLAEQRGLEQFRYLRCGLCACSWEVDRVWCPFCENRDYHKLGYLQVEGEEQKQRAATCDVCSSYLKVRTALTPLSTPQLLSDELALLHLDLIAMEKGYGQPA